MTPDAAGALAHPSPNHGERRGGARPTLVVLHYTAMHSAAEALERLCSPGHEVSAHYLVTERGEVLQLVAEHRRAWHAGVASWGGVRDVNSASIGIELCNPGDAPFAAPQMEALERLLADILGRHRLPPEAVIAHSDCAPGRKVDPGPRFDWRRLALAGLSVWPAPLPAGPAAGGDLVGDLRTFGYSADAPPEILLASFRLRFRPGAEGPPSAEDRALAADLARRFPVERGGIFA
jgi:N-acetylmuramoyl-L-alanine amidase